MKSIVKVIISIIIIVLSFISTCLSISYDKGILFIVLSLLVFYASLIFLIITIFKNKKLKDNIKKNKIKYIITAILFILLLYFVPHIIKYISMEDNITTYTHGKDIKEEELYTCDKANITTKYYSINNDLQEKSSKGKYKVLFNKDIINDVEINIHTDNLDYLRYNAKQKPTVMANYVRINDYKIKHVGLKTKGHTTLLPLLKTNNNLFSYTIKFKECINKKRGFEDNQNLLGLNKISFNNMFGDPTKMKEFLSYYLFTEMNVPTPEFALTTIKLNNQYQGLYFMLEPIDKALTKRTLNEDNDFLVKPGVISEDLLYDYELDNYIDENGEYNLDSLIKDEKGNIILPKDNILEKYNGIWENDVDTLEDVHKELPKFFKWLRKLNELSNIENKNTEEYIEELNKIIDVDSLLRYWAVNVYIINSDSYASQVRQNYSLYMSKEGKVTVIPWDYNYSFGASSMRDFDDVINYDINYPAINCDIKDRPLLNIIFGNDILEEKYKTYLKDVDIISVKGGTTTDNKEYPKNNLIKMIDNRSNDIIEAEKLNIQAFYTKEQIEEAQKGLKEIISLRSQVVNKQLNNDYERLHTDIKLDTLGGSEAVHKDTWNKMINKKD